MKVETLIFEMRVSLGKVDIPAAGYSELQVGDILILDQIAGAPLDIKIEDESLYKGMPGLLETRKAVRIV